MIEIDIYQPAGRLTEEKAHAGGPRTVPAIELLTDLSFGLPPDMGPGGHRWALLVIPDRDSHEPS
jgi:hypothetical protein